MSLREKGLRRTAALTIGITAASVVGSAVVAAVAWADTQASRAATSGTSSDTSGTGTSNSGTSSSDSGTSPSVSNTTGSGHATSGGT